MWHIFEIVVREAIIKIVSCVYFLFMFLNWVHRLEAHHKFKTTYNVEPTLFSWIYPIKTPFPLFLK